MFGQVFLPRPSFSTPAMHSSAPMQGRLAMLCCAPFCWLLHSSAERLPLLALSACIAIDQRAACAAWFHSWSVRPSIRPPVRPPVYPSVCPSVHPSVHPSVRLSVCPSVRPSVHPSVCQAQAPPSAGDPLARQRSFIAGLGRVAGPQEAAAGPARTWRRRSPKGAGLSARLQLALQREAAVQVRRGRAVK
jgi:hypothetical protein